DIDVYKDFCVDPEQTGSATFSVNNVSELGGVPQGELVPSAKTAAVASTNCRYSNETDGPFSWTLTNTDTGRVWTSKEREPIFEGVPSGAYTLPEEWTGSAITSQEFTFDPQTANLMVVVRN